MRDIIISICIMAFFLIHIQIKVVYFQDDIRICRIAHSSISISNIYFIVILIIMNYNDLKFGFWYMKFEFQAGISSAGTSRNKALYSDRIRQYVRSKLVFPGADTVDGNPEAVFEVKQLPNGEIVSITQKKSSGLPAWDSAVERALQRSSPLPRAEDGSVEPVLVLSFRPKDV